MITGVSNGCVRKTHMIIVSICSSRREDTYYTAVTLDFGTGDYPKPSRLGSLPSVKSEKYRELHAQVAQIRAVLCAFAAGARSSA